MRPEFRFPRSTIVLMLLILFSVILAIDKGIAVANGVEWTFSWTSLITRLLAAMAIISGAGVFGYAVVSVLRRVGLNRFLYIESWRERR